MKIISMCFLLVFFVTGCAIQPKQVELSELNRIEECHDTSPHIEICINRSEDLIENTTFETGRCSLNGQQFYMYPFSYQFFADDLDDKDIYCENAMPENYSDITPIKSKNVSISKPRENTWIIAYGDAALDSLNESFNIQYYLTDDGWLLNIENPTDRAVVCQIGENSYYSASMSHLIMNTMSEIMTPESVVCGHI